MVDRLDICKSLNVNIGIVMKNLGMLKNVPNHLKTKKMCKHGVKNLPYLLRQVSDIYKTQQICNKAILENSGTLKDVPVCYENREIKPLRIIIMD